MTRKQAKSGGERGVNGEWYNGGEFLPSNPNRVKGSILLPKTTGKQEIEPYVWEHPPVGMRSLYRKIIGVCIFDKDSKTMTIRENLNWRNMGWSDEAVSRLRAEVELFNSGARWISRT